MTFIGYSLPQENWKQGVLASRVLLLSTILSAAIGYLYFTGAGQRALFGLAAFAFASSIYTGWNAKQEYLLSEDANASPVGGDD